MSKAVTVRAQKLRRDNTKLRLYIFLALVAALLLAALFSMRLAPYDPYRSEERRVGKECRL